MELRLITLIVDNYDKAINYYCQILGFKLEQDTQLSSAKRWVVVNTGAAKLLLAQAASEEQQSFIGNQSGGRVFLFAYTKTFDNTYNRLLERGVHFIESPRSESYGKVVVFKDIYGNLWDLIEEPKTSPAVGKAMQTPWFNRKFHFDHSQFIFPSILERLEGTPLRLSKKVENLNEEIAAYKPEGKWSIKEHIAHLADLEVLWQNRCQDILNKSEYMRETDLTNSQIEKGRFNEKSLEELLSAFVHLRQDTLHILQQLSQEQILSGALHPRLHQPMSIHDLFLFVAEHDDHHLAQISHIQKNRA